MKNFMLRVLVILTLFLSTYALQSMNALFPRSTVSPLDRQLLDLSNQMYEDTGTLQKLIQAGANVNAIDDYGSALMRNAERGRFESVNILLNAGAQVNAVNKDQETALHFAFHHQSGGHDLSNVITRLLKAGANPNIVDKKGFSPLATGISHRTESELFDLLANAQADIKLQSSDQSTLLHLAAARSPGALEWLVKQGLDVNARNNNGKTPLHLARHADTVKILLIAGANPYARDNQGHTPFDSILNAKGFSGDDFKKSILNAFVKVYPHDVQGIYQTILALKKKSEFKFNPLPKDIFPFIMKNLVPELVKEKLAMARRIYPEKSPLELEKNIFVDAKQVLDNLPTIGELDSAAAARESLIKKAKGNQDNSNF